LSAVTGALVFVPRVAPVAQFGPRQVGRGFLWGVRFLLPSPAPMDGHIVQELNYVEQSVGPASNPPHLAARRYWEAWSISRGRTTVDAGAPWESTVLRFAQVRGLSPGAADVDTQWHVLVNDFFYGQFAGSSEGEITVIGVARYQPGALPAHFVPNNPRTFAKNIPSTTQRPAFWQDFGRLRILKFTMARHGLAIRGSIRFAVTLGSTSTEVAESSFTTV
jgi:hypothetical protein